jgi:hypothetical protein
MTEASETVRCEDCAQQVPIAASMISDEGLVCAPCASERDRMPPIVTPMWTRLRRAIGIARRS